MTLTLRFLGLELLHLCIETTAEEDADPAASLDGGALTSESIGPGEGDRHMGFTGGWETGDG